LNVYALVALAIIPLYLAIPRGRHQNEVESGLPPGLASAPPTANSVAILYALMAMLSNGLNSALSAHMVGILSELGLAAALAVTASSLRGVGQSAARLAEVLFGGRLHPIVLNLVAACVMPLCLVVGLASGRSLAAAMVFTFFYGASTGILTITRGTLPLVLFDATAYGAYVGKLLVPSFLFAAASPLIFAAVIERHTAQGALYLALFLALGMFAVSLVLKTRANRRAAS
jgi:hypothetical protein